LKYLFVASPKFQYLSNMKSTASTKNGQASAYITKRVMVSSSRAAVRSAAARAIESVGYVIKADNGWVIREGKDGTKQKIAKYKTSKRYNFALD
jgi:hypothetical protein